MPVYRLPEDRIIFPDPSLAEENGFLAVGGDLSVERLLLAYGHGIFPWYNPGEEICWWCPKERWVIRPAEIHISHSMRKFMRHHEISAQLNRDFAATMHRCRTKREGPDGPGTWISDEMEEAYLRLHKEGYAMSLEAVLDGEIAGGLYGVAAGRIFCGESMYSDRENGSKVALILLARILERLGFALIDCQLHTDHLESMGAVKISREEYQRILEDLPETEGDRQGLRKD